MAKWLDIALLKSLRRIGRAVELDDLTAVDDLVRYTTSAVDLRTVLGQVAAFWRQLGWPDPETAYVFVSRILDDACRASVFYAERMAEKVAGGGDAGEDEDPARDEEEVVHFNRAQCLAVNNIDFVLKVGEKGVVLYLWMYFYSTSVILDTIFRAFV